VNNGTRVTVEHFGWDTIPQENAARHGFPLGIARNGSQSGGKPSCARSAHASPADLRPHAGLLYWSRADPGRAHGKAKLTRSGDIVLVRAAVTNP
jgi:hypothetical protein